jgi:hypothetical protein
VKRQYFFGYFFARSAKLLALLVLSMGVGFCALEYSQATAAASAATYQSSNALQRALGNLRDAFSAASRSVLDFDAENRLTAPRVDVPNFPASIDSNDEFARVDEILVKVDRDRQHLKESIVSRFEELVKNIEGKLRAYAAGVESSSSPSVITGSSPAATAKPVTISTEQDGLLFSSRLGIADVTKRSADLNARKEFLKVLETKAENPENRASLTEAVTQLEALGKLLPEKPPAQADVNSAGTNGQQPEQSRRILPAARVAEQLEQIRNDVRQIFLSSWTLDDAFDQAADLNSVEREKCRVANLAQKGIWLSTMSRILVAMLAAVMVSFVIVVCADLVKTFLDTASHTGVVADAINAMRGATVIAKNQIREPWTGDRNFDDINN